jgi:hypothetical protein
VNTERLADIGAASSILAWVASIAAQTLPIVQWLAGVVAIVAGICAAVYHIKKSQ